MADDLHERAAGLLGALAAHLEICRAGDASAIGKARRLAAELRAARGGQGAGAHVDTCRLWDSDGMTESADGDPLWASNCDDAGCPHYGTHVRAAPPAPQAAGPDVAGWLREMADKADDDPEVRTVALWLAVQWERTHAKARGEGGE